jgi:hypothetical protein
MTMCIAGKYKNPLLFIFPSQKIIVIIVKICFIVWRSG